MRITPKDLSKLEPNEVIVFGSNTYGFHGSGTAGYCFRGNSDERWRDDKFFIDAINSLPGSKERIGKYAIFGQSKGLMQGREGKSYAIETIWKPGYRRSVDLELIKFQVNDFILTSKLYENDLKFYVTELGCNLAGYKVKEIAPLFKKALNCKNIYLPMSFIRELELQDSKEKQEHLEKVKNNLQIANNMFGNRCLHDSCQLCKGTGIKLDGSICIHNISCSCPKCSFR